MSPVESLPRELGAASARLDIAGSGRVEQSPDLRSSVQYDPVPLADEEVLRDALPTGARLLPVREEYDSRRLVTDGRALRVSRVAVDLSDPALTGPYRVLEGRAPSTDDEIAVSVEVFERGAGLGETVELSGEQRTVTGVVQLPRISDPRPSWAAPPPSTSPTRRSGACTSAASTSTGTPSAT